MILIIPLIAALISFTGVGTLFWYGMLPDSKKVEYDRLVLELFKKLIEKHYGIRLDDSDNLRELKEKTEKKGLKEKDVQAMIMEAQGKAKEKLNRNNQR